MKRKYSIDGMSCAACSSRVEREVSSLPGVERCEVNLLLGSMSLWGNEPEENIFSAVKRAGYGIESADKMAEGNQNDSFRYGEASAREGILLRLVSSAVLLLLLMYVSMAYNIWGAPMPAALAENPMAQGLIQLMLCALVLLINKQFFISGARALLKLSPNMDTLVALGSGASFVYSVVRLFVMTSKIKGADIVAAKEILRGLYFESAAMILLLITVGKLLEDLAKGKTTVAINELMLLTPKTVTVERNGNEMVINASELEEGDTVIVRQGENICADGVVTFGEGSVNEATLTGESIPADKSVGMKVFGGTTLLSGYLKLRAERVGENTAISEIIQMVKDASGSKAPVAKVADRVSGIFVPAVILMAAITCTVWLLLGAGAGYALSRGVSVLVISCPCALGLATPVAIMVGSGVGARCGILYKNAEALELSGRIKTVALDKTGTVTEGRPFVCQIICLGAEHDEIISKAYALEVMSEHPLARALVAYSEEKLNNAELARLKDSITGFKSEPGGVLGYFCRRALLCGNIDFIEKRLGIKMNEQARAAANTISKEGKTALILAEEDKILGIIALADRIKEDSRQAIIGFKKLGLRVVMLTGDNEGSAASVAASVGIDEIYAGIFPADKAEHVKRLRQEGKVMMVGDGINDSLALTVADVGMAIGRGANIAVDSASVVLCSGSLVSAYDAVRLGRRTLRNIYLNLFWAFCYNIVGIPLAAGVLSAALGWALQPMFAALAMSISSFLVVSSSLSINLFSRTEPSEKFVPVVLGRSEHIDSSLEADRSNHILIKENNEMKTEIMIKIEGMMCPHCSGRVKATLEALKFVCEADVSHERADAIITVKQGYDVEELKACIENAGYKVVG